MTRYVDQKFLTFYIVDSMELAKKRKLELELKGYDVRIVANEFESWKYSVNAKMPFHFV